MNKLSLCLFLLLLLPLVLISQTLLVLPGSGIADTDQSKQYHFKYHNFVDDFHLSGPRYWGVRFDFKSAYAIADSASFNLEKILFYSPIAGVTLKLSLRTDTVAGGPPLNYFYYPGAAVPGTSEVSITTVAGQNDVLFTGSVNALQVVWLQIEVLNPVATNYLSASEGSGKNSYYNITGSSWTTLNNAGFGAELRFGAVGTFNLKRTKLQLLDFSLGENLVPDAVVYPSCTVVNHSATNLNAQLQVSAFNNSETFNETFTIDIQDLPSEGTETYISPFGITLPRDPAQIRTIAKLIYENAPGDSTISHFKVYTNKINNVLVEHFKRFNNVSGTIPALQDSVHHLLYFPTASDSLYTLAAVQRFNYYTFNSLPKVVVQGKKRFHLNPAADSLEVFTDLAKQKNTYISASSCSLTVSAVNPNIRNMDLRFSNTNTDIFDWNSTLGIGAPSLFAGLYIPHTFAGRTYYALKKWLIFDRTITTAMGLNSQLAFRDSFNVADIDSSLVQNLRIYYWLQNSLASGGEIIYAANAQFPHGYSVSAEDEYLPAPVISLFPNPLRGSAELKVSSLRTPTRFSIYNLKGQKLFSTELDTGELKVPSAIFPSSGIYFVRSESISGKPNRQTIKFTVIK